MEHRGGGDPSPSRVTARPLCLKSPAAVSLRRKRALARVGTPRKGPCPPRRQFLGASRPRPGLVTVAPTPRIVGSLPKGCSASAWEDGWRRHDQGWTRKLGWSSRRGAAVCAPVTAGPALPPPINPAGLTRSTCPAVNSSQERLRSRYPIGPRLHIYSLHPY